ncbi:MAG: peptidoglycan DD-metalloendopeptidase family protein [Candidatus Omnitrophota bacterium]|nr:peptidoglycan DD-metalloendopeptidase family protein [Candidatus Omnitrophota bacterium]
MFYLRIVSAAIFIFILGGCARAPVVSPPREVTPTVKREQGIYHKVVKGETLWRISKNYGVELEKVISSNGLSDAERIEVGQMIFIPSASRPAESKVPGTAVHSKEDFIWPLKGRVISSFGERQGITPNKGIDIQASAGVPVVAARSGRVIFSEDKLRGYGKTVILDHGDGYQTVYAHNSEILVKIGERVAQSDAIAKVGSTGRNQTPYLHFEIRKGHKPHNPFHYLP